MRIEISQDLLDLAKLKTIENKFKLGRQRR